MDAVVDVLGRVRASVFAVDGGGEVADAADGYLNLAIGFLGRLAPDDGDTGTLVNLGVDVGWNVGEVDYGDTGVFELVRPMHHVVTYFRAAQDARAGPLRGKPDLRVGFEAGFHHSVDNLNPDSPLASKLRRLLVFYERKLTTDQARLLSIVALFRSPVAEEPVVRLARGLFGKRRKAPLRDDATLAGDLRLLHLRGVLTREPIVDGQGYACHPILRDHFRILLLSERSSTARRAADLIKGRDPNEPPKSVQEIELVLVAIELLLGAGEFLAADELFRARLDNGRVFLNIPAIAEGVRCASGFVRDESLRQQCEKNLGERRLRFYLNDVGVFFSIGGRYEVAGTFLTEADAINRKTHDSVNRSLGLLNESELSVSVGRLAEATAIATESLDLALEHRVAHVLVAAYSERALAQTLSGQLGAAVYDFALANAV